MVKEAEIRRVAKLKVPLSQLYASLLKRFMGGSE